MYKIIERLSKQKYEELMKQGYILPGHNGPYIDQETPVRNTSHWLILFGYMYLKTKDEKYYDAVVKSADFLINPINRPEDATFYCRNKEGKDQSNGLIGQAWTIEALAEAYKVTNKMIYLDTAIEVFLLHPFDKKAGLWKVVETNGVIKSFDMTFNHQLWFAMSGAILLSLKPNDKIKQNLECFFSRLNKH